MTVAHSHMPMCFKPDDLVRTPSGRTGTVIRINADGTRTIKLLSGEVLDLLPATLFLVRAAVPRPWPSYTMHFSFNGD